MGKWTYSLKWSVLIDAWGVLLSTLPGWKVLCFAKGTPCRKEMGRARNFQCEKRWGMLSVGCLFLAGSKGLWFLLLAFETEERMPLQGPAVFVVLIMSEGLKGSAFWKINDSVNFYPLAWVVCIIELLNLYFARLACLRWILAWPVGKGWAHRAWNWLKRVWWIAKGQWGLL